MTSKDNFEKTLAIIKENESKGMVTFMTECGMMTTPIESLCRQSADGLLYDLNRDEATTLHLGKVGMGRWVNDYAVAQVIRFLLNKKSKEKNK